MSRGRLPYDPVEHCPRRLQIRGQRRYQVGRIQAGADFLGVLGVPEKKGPVLSWGALSLPCLPVLGCVVLWESYRSACDVAWAMHGFVTGSATDGSRKCSSSACLAHFSVCLSATWLLCASRV